MKLNVKETVKLKIGRKKYEFQANSPTSQFYDHVYNEITAPSPSTILLPIKRISIIDTLGEEACISQPGAGWNVSVSGSTLTISATCTWQSYENPNKIRIWGVDAQNNRYLYFETSVPPGVSAQNGLPVSITWNLVLGFENVSSSGYLSGASVNMSPLSGRIITILADLRNNRYLTLAKIVYTGRYGTQYGITILQADLIRDQSSKRVYLPATRVQNQGEILNVNILGSDNTALIGYTPASPISVGPNDYIMFELVFAT